MPQGLCIKVSAQPLIRKWFFIFRPIKLIFTRKVVLLASFCKWGFLGLGSLQKSSPIWASEASRARTRERAPKPREGPRPPFSRLLSRATRASAFHDIPKWRACSQDREWQVAYQFWGRNSIGVQKFKLYETILTVALIPFRISQKIWHGIFPLNFDWSPFGIKF